MLKHRESHALRLVPVRSSDAEDTRLLELVHGGRLSKAALRQMLRQVDLKRSGLRPAALPRRCHCCTGRTTTGFTTASSQRS